MTTATLPKTEKEAIKFVTVDAVQIKLLPISLQTKKVCEAAFKAQPYQRTILNLPAEHVTFAMLLRAAPNYGSETKDFANWARTEDFGISQTAFVKLVKKGELPNLNKVTDQEVILLCYKKAFAEDKSLIKTMPKEIIEKVLNVANVNDVIRFSN